MRRDETYLLDILIAARKALKFVEGIDQNKFEDNEIIQNAVIRPWKLSARLLPEFQKIFVKHMLKFPGRKWSAYVIVLSMNTFELTSAQSGIRFIKISRN